MNACDNCNHNNICNKTQVACSWFQDYESNKEEYPYLKARIDELKEKLKQVAIELDVTRETAETWEELCHEKSDYLEEKCRRYRDQINSLEREHYR